MRHPPRSVLLAVTGEVALAAATVPVVTAQGATSACTVRDSVTSRWDGGFHAEWSRSGTTVTATNESWNGPATGGRVSAGFIASRSGRSTVPTAFMLNGTTRRLLGVNLDAVKELVARVKAHGGTCPGIGYEVAGMQDLVDAVQGHRRGQPDPARRRLARPRLQRLRERELLGLHARPGRGPSAVGGRGDRRGHLRALLRPPGHEVVRRP